jgi:hypothetical protein
VRALATAVDVQICQNAATLSIRLDESGTAIALRKAVGMAGLPAIVILTEPFSNITKAHGSYGKNRKKRQWGS